MVATLAVLLLLVLHSGSSSFQSDSQLKLKNWEYEYRITTLEANLKATQQVLADFLSAFTNNTRTMKDVEKTLLKSTEIFVNHFMVAHKNETIGMQTRIVQLNKVVTGLESSLGQTQSDLTATKKAFNDYVASNQTWSLKRVEITFPRLTRISLHQSTPTYVEKLPTSLPKATRAVIVSIFCSFWNGAGHSYLNLKINQKGNEKAGYANLVNTHYNVYANNFYYEVMLPWDSSKPEEIVFKITGSYHTGGVNNWYTVKVVGYITA